MSVHNVELIRGYVLRKMKDLKIYVSCLEPTEMDALRAMDGVKGQQLAAQIADFVLERLGHQAPHSVDSPSMRQARGAYGGRDILSTTRDNPTATVEHAKAEETWSEHRKKGSKDGRST